MNAFPNIHASDVSNVTRTARAHRPGRLLACTLLLALAGGAWQAASADPGMPGRPGPGMAGHGMAGPGMAGPRGIERALDKIEATPEQRVQIQQIMTTARNDSKAMREQAKALHQESQALFSQTTVDARAAEALRQKMLLVHDQSSKRQMQVMLDISRVLSPAQRQKLADLMNQRRAMMAQHAASAASGPFRRP